MTKQRMPENKAPRDESDRQEQSVADQSARGGSTARIGRRRILKSGLVAAPFIVTLKALPVPARAGSLGVDTYGYYAGGEGNSPYNDPLRWDRDYTQPMEPRQEGTRSSGAVGEAWDDPWFENGEDETRDPWAREDN